MVTLKRLGIYLVIFFVTVSLLIVFVNFRSLDNYLVNQVNKASFGDFELNKEIVLVNLEEKKTGSDGTDLKQYRQDIISLLNTIAAEAKGGNGPKGVVLDLWFSDDTTEKEQLTVAFKQLKDLKVPFYASYKINESQEHLEIADIDIDAVENRHATWIYSGILAGSELRAGAGRYHTYFNPEAEVANYENDLYFYSEFGRDSVLIGSLARKVAMDLNSSASMSHIPKRIGSVVPYRSLSAMEKATYAFIPGENQGPGTFKKASADQTAIDMDENILLVGDMINDQVDITSNRQIPGPYIVGWALSDLLDNNASLKLPIESLYLIIGQILFFSFFSVLIYSLLFKYIKRLQTKPAVIAAISFVVTLLLFFVYFKVVLGFSYVIPASHTIVATCVACILSYRFANKFLVTGIAEGSQKYDVFISYSRSQSEWVDKYVYEPLAAYIKPDGNKLNIFYDKKSIGVGEMFTTKYMWAIVDTGCFIPIFSTDYYSKNHCRNEMDCAMKRGVEKLLSIQAIALSMQAVPEAFTAMNYVDVTQNPNFITTIEAELSKKYAVTQPVALTIEAEQKPGDPVNGVLPEKESLLVIKEESKTQSNVLLVETHQKNDSIPDEGLMWVEKGPENLLNDGFLLKRYCLEKAIEVYKSSQSITVIELAEQFERYLKAQETGNGVTS